MSYQLMSWASQQTTGSHTRKAVLLALANRANHDTGRCDPSIETIAAETELGERAVRQALADLCDSGLISRERKRRGDGSLGTYRYFFPAADPAQPAAADAGRPAARDAALNQEEPNQEIVVSEQGVPVLALTAEEPSQRVTRARPWKVDRRTVTEPEESLAREVLADWNLQAGQDLTSRDWLAKIIMRAREHPELHFVDHSFIIQRTLASPWWDDHPSPSVVYGNGAQFERCITAARNGHASARPKQSAMRYGRGMTTRQILDEYAGR